VWFWRPSAAELELDRVVRSIGRPATRLEVLPLASGEELVATATKFGGSPYAETGDVWPTWQGRPYDFFAQIDFQECFDPPSPAVDLMVIFGSWSALESGDLAEDACLIRGYFNPSVSKAIELKRPECVPSDYRIRPCRVRMSRMLTFPSSVARLLHVPEIADLVSEFSLPEAAYIRSLKWIGYGSVEYASRVGLYPTWVHGDTMDDDDLVFLTQLAFEPKANNCIGDAAPLYIASHRSNPSRFEFDAWQSY
jgi:hypothetical protein